MHYIYIYSYVLLPSCVKDLLFRQVGLEDHHSLRCPATQTKKSSSVDIDETILDHNKRSRRWISSTAG